ncbi:MAG: hypothetical protein IPM33_01470 [Phycisphaerales bacterium]|nr:hypothetical protein [Phycisphaerales bacterium]
MGEDPNILVELTTARTEFEAATMAESLKAQGIPAEVFAGAANMLQWHVTSTDPIKVMVRRQDVEKARAALRDVRADSVDIDWADVDVGSPEPGSVLPGPRMFASGSVLRKRRLRMLGFMLLFTSMLMVAFQPTRMSGLIGVVLIGAIWAWSAVAPPAPPARSPTRPR